PSACPASWCTSAALPGISVANATVPGYERPPTVSVTDPGSARIGSDAPAEDRDLRRPRRRQRRQQGLRPDRDAVPDHPVRALHEPADGGPHQRTLDALMAAARLRSGRHGLLVEPGARARPGLLP